MFRFKQFSVDQSDCAMKINTDGVLLGALVKAGCPGKILDIGTGTGVIALMLAQRFTDAGIMAVEIDKAASQTASRNFANSPFNSRMQVAEGSFQEVLNGQPEVRYDLIVSNPPFFINSLRSASRQKELARHTDELFFDDLLFHSGLHLNTGGMLWLILPPATSSMVIEKCPVYGLYIQSLIHIHSFSDSPEHREILALGLDETVCREEQFIIYSGPKSYSDEYKNALKGFLTIF